jgi:pre-mRNA-processing factor 39
MTMDAVQKRWPFESAIKRSYFHIKPLDEAQKQNWKNYLNFEEAEGDIARIYALYERCMVPCVGLNFLFNTLNFRKLIIILKALYEEFWYRYAMFLQSKGDSDRAYNVFVRATSIFVPQSRSKIRLAYALFLESQTRLEEARGVYESFLEANPGHIEVTLKLALFEARQSDSNKCSEILDTAEAGSDDPVVKGYYKAQKIKQSLKVLNFKKYLNQEWVEN